MYPDRFDGLMPSPLSFLDREAGGDKKIIRFDVAEPMFAPPAAAVQATKDALSSGFFRYSSSWGIPELREAISEFLISTRKVAFSAGEVLVTTGGKFANFAFFASLLRQGDAVVLIRPFWTSFKSVPSMLGVRTLEVWSNPPYRLDEEALKSAIAHGPRAIVLNSPNNPTGGILGRDDLKLVRDLAEDHDLLVLSDEIDWAYAYKREFVSPASIDGLRERTVLTDGFSKVFCMTGWRVGFAAGPRELISRLHQVQEHAVSAPSTFAQYGCLRALEGYRDYIRGNLDRCRSNLRMVLEALNALDGIRCPEPEGGFYVYPEISPLLCPSKDFAEGLLSSEGVAVVPGEYFGDTRGRFRLCYAVDPSVLSEGLERIARFVESKQKR